MVSLKLVMDNFSLSTSLENLLNSTLSNLQHCDGDKETEFEFCSVKQNTVEEFEFDCSRCGKKVSLMSSIPANLRSGVPYIFCRGGKVRLIQLLDYLSVASPEYGLFSDWSRNKKVLRTEP